MNQIKLLRSLYIILFCLIINTAHSAVITVDTDEFSNATNNNCSLTEALLSAGFDFSFDQCISGNGDDVINFEASLFNNILNTMLVNVTDTLPVFQDSIDIQVPAGKTLSLLGNQMNPIFSIDLEANSTFSLNNTSLNLGTSTTAGGAMQFSGEVATINLNNVSFLNNHSNSDGGAIGFARDANNVSNVTLNITNCLFSNNSSDANGGAIYAPEHIILEITNSDFNSNNAVATGGAVFTSWDADINNSLFDGGIATTGGAIFSNNKTLTIVDSVFQNNQGLTSGGAIYKAALFSETQDSLIFKRNTVLNNFSDGTAGIHLFYINLYAYNNLIANNTSASKTGGLNLFLNSANDGDHEVHLFGNTFYHNISNGSNSTAVADLNVYFSANNSSYIGNAIISTSQTSPIGHCKFVRTSQLNSKHNLSDTFNGCLVGSNNQILSNAMVVLQPTSNEFHPFEVIPQPGSPLIDAWLGSDCVDHNGVDIDFDLIADRRLFGVIYDGDADGMRDCDIGSTEVYEGAMISVIVTGSGSGLVSSDPSGITCNPDCNLAFPIDSEVTLTASADAGSQFIGFSGGSCGGISACTFTVSNNVTIQAEFQPETTHELSIIKTGDGGGFIASTVSGISCGGNCSSNFAENSEIILVASAGSNSGFIGWSGNCVANGLECIVTLTSDTVIEAQFDSLSHRLETWIIGQGSGVITSNPSGINCPPDCSEDFADDSLVTLNFTADAGTTFIGWGLDCSGTGDCLLTMSQARDAFADTDILHNLLVTVDGPGSVSSQPSGISCPSTCDQDFSDGEFIELIATPSMNANFIGWSGDCSGMGSCQFNINQDYQVTAHFEFDNYDLTILSNIGGHIASADGGIDCGTDCDETYSVNTIIQLTATPQSGYDFIGWSGGGTCIDSSLTCQVTIAQDTTINAVFENNDSIFKNGFEEL